MAEQQGSSRREVQRFDFDNGDERIVAPCQQKAEIKIHPIVDWRDSDVWSFLRDAKVDVNPVYNLGFQRVGCVGCLWRGKSGTGNFAYGLLLKSSTGPPLTKCSIDDGQRVN